MPLNKDIKKVLVIGSGPIVIGQAAEFDYAGAQACRVLRRAGVNVVLVNSNPATIMTDKALADEIYLEPLNKETLTRIIEKERPDSLLAGLGGQTGLTLATQLYEEGVLEKYGVRLLGTSVESIKKAEDRKLFKETMDSINQPCIPSGIANNVETALEIASRIGFPVIVRPAYTLGGSGGGTAYNEEELKLVAKTGLDMSPITQILVEKYIFGWKEVEFETMRDALGNVIAVCSMENVDPVGVHTGDSIVVAPALTLAAKEYNTLRSAALEIVSALGVVGGCNCQFALDPNSFEYAVIEVNPRVSRSSALASKATGYPIAKITTEIALGYSLNEIKNDITGKTFACFEPSIDYVVVKFPKWPFDKFVGASRKLGTQMKATGEVMSISTSFESALMKAIRGAEISTDTLNMASDGSEVRDRLGKLDDKRIFTIFEALKSGITVDEINEITKIDKWFLYKIQNLAQFEKKIENGLSPKDYELGKKLGYTDKALMRISGEKSVPGKDAVYKMVDTCAAEFDASTPYFYSTYDSVCESTSFKRSEKPVIMVLGSGPIRIGQGIEFDYSSVHCVWTLKEMGYDVVIVNNNPETVSTDYDTADRLYFEPLTPEDIMNIIKVEKPIGVVVAFGGQTAIKLTKFLDDNGIAILGTSAESIDVAEDRKKFDALLESFNIQRPKGCGVFTTEEALKTAHTLGYPVLLRPSYVIGGQNMTIAHSDKDVIRYMTRILSESTDNNVLVDKYMMGPELEVDVISDGTDVIIPGIMEHIERAGVHSGDSIAVYPPYNINDIMKQKIIECSTNLALAMKTKGLVNIQYLIYQNELYVIEVNPRASRTIPYISKVTGIPMTEIATKVMMGKTIKELGYETGLCKTPPYFTVKVPVFSFEKLLDVNAYLGPEMKSTGEVLGIGKTLNEALFKGLKASGSKMGEDRPASEKSVFISVEEHDYLEIVSLAKKFDDLGMKIYATPDTANAIKVLGIDVETTASMDDIESILSLIDSGKINYIVYTGAAYDDTIKQYIAIHRMALLHFIPCFTSLDTANAMADIVKSRFNSFNTELVDINNMRKEKSKLTFSKMVGAGEDYIVINNMNGDITCPESLALSLCDRSYGVGGDGLAIIEKSDVANCKMRLFNKDGSEGLMAGNVIRCIGKFIFDNKITSCTDVSVETASGIKKLKLYLTDGKVTSASVSVGKADFEAKNVPAITNSTEIINQTLSVNGDNYKITCLSVGNPHCVVFCDRVDGIDIETVGPIFENHPMFPQRVNTEFVRVVNPTTIKMRVYERGNGETMACGTGACAAVAAAIRNGFCEYDTDITVKAVGGDLVARCTKENITLTGDAKLVFIGETEY